ncbi:TPA: hypothetical protein IAD52_09770 [Candidatus Spyradomonas excrementavium]|nr:hypothetical protein [Candidatus Spyradomonas excrementavium]
MILTEFSTFLQAYYEKYDPISDKNAKTPVFLLFFWVKNKLETPAKTNVDKILQKEIYIAKNKAEDFFMIGKSPSGRKLIDALYNFALSFEQQQYARWIHERKPQDFKNC